jgi:hypothetical protein
MHLLMLTNVRNSAIMAPLSPGHLGPHPDGLDPDDQMDDVERAVAKGEECDFWRGFVEQEQQRDDLLAWRKQKRAKLDPAMPALSR